MEFPIYQFPYLGNGMAIGLDAVLHVILSHGFAIGSFSFVLMAEFWAWRKGLPAWEEFAHRLIKFLAIVITAVGAITGVGIWFFISVLEPRGTASLLRVFFWAWFIEWIAFTSEVISLLIYYFTWDRWTGKRRPIHMLVGLTHTGMAIFSAVLITGILGFMMTPDGWPWNRTFWAAFFNPTYFPMLILRLGSAFALGSVITAIFLLFTHSEAGFRRDFLSLLGKVGLVGMAVAALGGLWYWSMVPSAFKTYAPYAILTSRLSQQPAVIWIANGIFALSLLALLLLALAKAGRVVKWLAVPVLIACIVMVVEFERTREFVRGPYIMPGYMYANQVLLTEAPYYTQAGLLPNSYWYLSTTRASSLTDQGAYLFGQNCSVCHTIGGLNDMVARVKGRSQDGIYVIINHTHEMVPFMAPFSGTDQERQALAQFLFELSTGKIKLNLPVTRFMDVSVGR